MTFNFNIGRLNELAAEMPSLLRELGILIDQGEPIIIPVGAGLNLHNVNTGQATLFLNDKLNVDIWTTKLFDFAKKEWTHQFALNPDGQGNMSDCYDGVTATVTAAGGCILSCVKGSMKLPPFSKAYSGGAPVSSPMQGVSRFSFNPNRARWTTGQAVWLP